MEKIKNTTVTRNVKEGRKTRQRDNKYERKTQRINFRTRMTTTARSPRIMIRHLFYGTATYTHVGPSRQHDT